LDGPGSRDFREVVGSGGPGSRDFREVVGSGGRESRNFREVAQAAGVSRRDPARSDATRRNPIGRGPRDFPDIAKAGAGELDPSPAAWRT
jgi:hypothetical protein